MLATKQFIVHPFRAGILKLISEHFSDEIAKNFQIEFEANTFTRDLENIWRQVKDERFIVEVYYKTGEDTREYICDLMSWESKVMTGERLLTYISDKWATGKIGSDWVTKGGKIGVSQDITDGSHETIISESGGNKPPTRRIHTRRKAARTTH